jgi:hypothetical protein
LAKVLYWTAQTQDHDCRGWVSGCCSKEDFGRAVRISRTFLHAKQVEIIVLIDGCGEAFANQNVVGDAVFDGLLGTGGMGCEVEYFAEAEAT